MYKLLFKKIIFLSLFLSINLNAIEDLFFNNDSTIKIISEFQITTKENKLYIFNQNVDTWFLRIKNLENNELIINGYIYDKMIQKNINSGIYNVYIKDLKTNKEELFNLNFNVKDINDENNLIIDLAKLEEKIIFKNSNDPSYGVIFSKNKYINFNIYNKEPVFIRLSSFGKNILNGYYYGNLNQILEEGLYSLYIKTKYGEVLKNILILDVNNGVNDNLDIKEVNMIRDAPYFSDGKYLLNWYPIMYHNIKPKYLVQLKKDSKIESFITDNPLFSIKDLNYDFYRVFAYPSIIYSGKNIEELSSIYNLNNKKWFKINSNEIDYLIGLEDILEGDISQLSLYLPSGFSFTDKNDEYIITSADKGEVIYVKDNKFKRYKYKNDIGMPLSLAYPNYIGNGKFILTDDTNSRLVEFDLATFELKTIFGDSKGNYESNRLDPILNKNDKLGIISHMYKYENNIYFSNSLKFKENNHSWYSIPKSNPKLYKINKDKLIKQNINICDEIKCKALFNLKNSQIIVTSKEIIKYSGGKTIWSYKINSFGAGLVFIDDESRLLYGNHTELLMLDTNTGKKIDLEIRQPFANIVDIDKINDKEFVITDSDSGTIYFTRLIDNKLEVLNSISSSIISKPNIIKLKEINNFLYVLTSNPSYLFKMDLETYKIVFFIGNGSNSPAVKTDKPLEIGMYYPNDFFVDEDGIIYISESNHRILRLNRKDLSIFAGSRYHGNTIGKQKCNSALFTNVRGLTKIAQKLVIADSGNKRLLSINKKDEDCILDEIIIAEDDKSIKFNNLTYLYKFNGDNYLIEQNANRIIKFDDNFKITDNIGLRRNTVYQGMGKDDEYPVKKELANFNTPTDICFDDFRNVLYITDTFNGKIKNINGGEHRNG